jgi:hypothetical protein
MSDSTQNSTQKWFWTDDLARLLNETGHELVPPLDRWLRTPIAVRASGNPLEVAAALLATTSAA